MTMEQFRESLSASLPPSTFSQHLQSLWYDAKGEWERSHDIIQDIEDAAAAWIHAYLHRKEGDLGNADYWYQKAARKRPSVSLQQEWENIFAELINR